jgi:hypothetical protein
MEKSQFTKRNERYKNKRKEGPPTLAMGLGLLWIIFAMIPDQWKSTLVSVLILILTFYISIRFDKLKLPLMIKWGIALSVYGIGLVLFLIRY